MMKQDVMAYNEEALYTIEGKEQRAEQPLENRL